ncbi:insulinase family protein [Flavobacterium filum]|uniref:M16 family metallopeptidase n=1 Tax=Flavobacterium filum TaxID=370974 RepID=UPI0023F111C3|nr:insulinase family protein [Flavobacterium filum]
MNRLIAPNIVPLNQLITGFPSSNTNLYCIYSEDELFKLEIVCLKKGSNQAKDKHSRNFAIDLMLSGTKDLSSSEISEHIDLLGAYIYKSFDYYSSSITLYGMQESADNLIGFTINCIKNCQYSQSELDVYKNNKLSELKINLEKTSFLSNRGITELTYGKDHMNCDFLNEEKIKSINREELIQINQQLFEDYFFVYTGPKTLDIEKIIKDNGYEIKTLSNNLYLNEIVPINDSKQLVIKKEKSTQNSLRLSSIWPSRSDSSYFDLVLLNMVFGGYFGSRLMKNIREEKGLTYGINSSINSYLEYSVMKINCECNSQLTETVIQEIWNEAEKLKTMLVSEDELNTAKNYLKGALIRSFDGSFTISEKFKSFKELQLKDNYYQEYFEHINAVSPDKIRELANNYLDRKTFNLCIAGEH